jgi:type II secretory pathway predicted ATPase ExeA
MMMMMSNQPLKEIAMTALNDFYGFQLTPFSRSIPTQHLFPAQAHQEIQARLSFALHERLPALITGDVGTGKSTALRAFVHTLDHNLFPLIYLANPHLKVTALYAQILLALQVEPAYSFNRLLPQFHNTLADLTRQGRYPLLILDEAHRLSPDIFDQLRFLLNNDFDSASALTLVLLGQPDLAHLLRFAPYQALDQRLAVRYCLRPFDLEESAAYVKHQLRIAGYHNQLFSDAFIAALHDYTKGVARQINNLCRAALLLGVTESKQILDETDLKRVIRDQDGQPG